VEIARVVEARLAVFWGLEWWRGGAGLYDSSSKLGGMIVGL